jgi:hypothetical protein
MVGDKEFYTGYTSVDRRRWIRGGTWTHTLGKTGRLGLVSMGGSGFKAQFDYVWVYRPSPVPIWLSLAWPTAATGKSDSAWHSQ